jgi:hypothetical protein
MNRYLEQLTGKPRATEAGEQFDPALGHASIACVSGVK